MPVRYDHIARINALTRNARNTWFALLGVLVFITITLLGVEHIDFYGVNRTTKLPLVNVSLPTRSFFVAAPIITSAIFGYFHLYLIRLWDAISVAPPQISARPLGDVIAPWLVADAALYLRAKLRSDNCTTLRTMEGPAMLLNLLLAWCFGLLILGLLWWMSMPARNWWITGISGLSLIMSGFVGAASFAMLIIRMRNPHDGTFPQLWSNAPAMCVLIVMFPTIVIVGLQRTMGSANALAYLDLSAEFLVDRPVGWLPHAIARREFLAQWCRREQIQIDACNNLRDRQVDFDTEWKIRHTAAMSDMRRPDWLKAGNPKPDLRNVGAARAFFTGTNLSGAQMQGADLRWANMRKADLSWTSMQKVDLRWANLQEANLQGAEMQGADFRWAKMEAADFSLTQLQKTDFRTAHL